MDPRLLEATQQGNLHLLNGPDQKQCIHPRRDTALRGAGHTPSHVACIAGHLNFTRELLKLMPKLAEKVKADGFSPSHIAAARGDVETVKEILKVGPHYAAANGEVGDALHLSVKNNWFDALVALVEHLKQLNKEKVINWNDKKGDTILHLAAAAKKFEVVDSMLGGHALKREVMEVNSLNESGSPPLDVSPLSDREIREILVRAGAKHGQPNLPSSQIVLVDDDGDDEGDIKGATSCQSVMKPAFEDDHPPSSPPKDSNRGQKPSGDVRSDMLVVAVLLASATYQAVLQPITLLKKDETHTKKGFLAAYLNGKSLPTRANLPKR